MLYIPPHIPPAHAVVTSQQLWAAHLNHFLRRTRDASAQAFPPSPLDLPHTGQNQCSQRGTAPRHWLCTQGDHCSLSQLSPEAAPGPWWQRSAPSPSSVGQELPSAGPQGMLRPRRGARIPAQLPAPCGNRCGSLVVLIGTQSSQGWLCEAEWRICPKKFTWEMKSPFLFG